MKFKVEKDAKHEDKQMKGKWLSDELYDTGKARVELSPQIVELECNLANLDDSVTAPHYRVGQRDARGRIIMPEKTGDIALQAKAVSDPFGVVKEGQKMACVDYGEKHLPRVWNLYVLQETQDKDHEGKPISRFLKVSQFADKKAAVAEADKVS